MPSSKVAPTPSGEVAATNPSEQSEVARLRTQVTTLEAQVEQLEAENEQLKSGSGAAAPPATKPKDTPEQAKLRAQVEEALKPLQEAQNKEATSKKHALPESLEKFTTLAEEKDIIEVAEPLRALEAAVARDPDSKEAAAALGAALKKLVAVMKAKIEERADKADLKALLKECEATITAGNRDFCLLYTSPSPRDRTRSRMPSSA